MKRILSIIILFTISLAAYGQEELKIWNEFISLVKNNQMTVNRIKPLDQLGDQYKPIFLGFLDSLRILVSSSDWETVPEIIKKDNRLQYIVSLSNRGKKKDFCFSFEIDNTQWFFQHIESIFIRLDKLPPLPVSTFPDISESQKAYAREEIYWSFIITNIYLPVTKEKGVKYALALLKDGGGYFVNAKTWVPFTSPQQAFILYLCWEQSNLRGNPVTLEKLSDTQAVVAMESQFFSLYLRTGHLKTLISFEEYKSIFETIWQDRAKNAGWNLDIKYSPDHKVVFNFNLDK